MSKLPQISGKEMSNVLIRLGFSFNGQKGSHMKFIKKHPRGKEVVVIPNHKTLRPGTLVNILGKLSLSAEKLKELI